MMSASSTTKGDVNPKAKVELSEKIRLLVNAVAGLCNLSVFAFVSILGPFYPPLAVQRFDASSFQIGLVFSMYPLAQIITAPFGSALCQRYGRLRICAVGLLILSVATMFFAIGQDIHSHMLARTLQGFAGALVNISAFALVMESSSNLTRDMGIQEVLTGAGYMLGPPVGGFLYTLLGLETMFFMLSIIPLLMATILVVILRPLHIGAGTSSSSMTALQRSSSSTSVSSTLWCNPTVALVSLALITDAAALGFLDPTLSHHLKDLLGLDIRGIGLVFALPPLIYSTSALLVYPLSDRLGNKNTVALGLLLVAFGFAIIGPAPAIGSSSSSPSAPEWYETLLASPSLSWFLIIFSLTMEGIGSALVVVPAVPLMLHAVEKRPEDDFKDGISAMYTIAWSVGDWLGPFLGGLLEDLVPLRPEIRCEGGGECMTPFRWSSTIFAIACLGVWFLLVFLVKPDEEGEGGEAEDVEEAVAMTRSILSPQRTPFPTTVAAAGERDGLIHHHHHHHHHEGNLQRVGDYHTISHLYPQS